ncbi:MAG: glycosyltransferase family 2 protein [Aureliella sp.]
MQPAERSPDSMSTDSIDMEIDLSIVIVSWNTRRILDECLESVFQGVEGVRAEVFVVDNASSDGSAAMVADKYPQVHLIENRENLGFARANNQAIRIARGRHVLLLNSDTVILDDVLRRSVEYLNVHSSVGVMGCRVLNKDGTVQLTCSRYPTLLNLLLLTSGLFRFSRPSFLGRYQLRDWSRDTERDVDTVTGCFMLVRRSALDEVGLLDERFFFYGEETDWCRRFKDSGWQLRFAPVGEIVHYGSLSSRQCNHRRDVMLTRGLLQYHRKHSGAFTVATAWLLLGMFCALRSVYWGVLAVNRRNRYARERCKHFCGVLASFRETWPPRMEAQS